jgi:transcriptional regulator with XRE-family HTH domain
VVADIKADWARIRQAIEAGGSTQKQIAQEFGVTQQAVSKRAKRYGWGSNSRPVIASHQTGNRGLATPDRMTAIVDAVESGLTITQAGKLLKLNRQTVANWVSGNAEFADEVSAAEQRRIQTQIGNIARASETDWRAAHVLVKAYSKDVGDMRFVDTPTGDRSGPGIVVNIGGDRASGDPITIEN